MEGEDEDTDEDDEDSGDCEHFYEIEQEDLNEAVSYVRELFKYFKKSPLKMSQLQVFIKEGEGKEFALLLDVRTRWNSVLPMLERYFKVKKYMVTCLEKLNEAQRYTIRYDDLLKGLVDALKPIQEAVVMLSKPDSNLLIAEGALNFVIGQLQSQDTEIAGDLRKAVIDRYNVRRNSKEVALLSTLTRKEFPGRSEEFENVKKSDVKATATTLLQRLYPNPETETAEDGTELEMEAASANTLEDAILQTMKPSKKPSAMVVNLDKDFKLLEASGEITARLEKIRQALLTIKPTSTICEQAFSVATSFKSKSRNRLSAARLNALMWLKTFFLKSSL